MTPERIYSAAAIEYSLDGDRPKFSGYASRFMAISDPEMTAVNGYSIRIMPGAFREALAKKADIVALYNHESGEILGRQSNSTLRLFEDSHGLRFEIIPPNDSLGQRVATLVKDGYVKGCSFGFWTPTSKSMVVEENEGIVLEWRACDLFEISLTPMPMFPASSVKVQSLLSKLAEQKRERFNADLESEELDLLRLSL